jgi:hypothetical protein
MLHARCFESVRPESNAQQIKLHLIVSVQLWSAPLGKKVSQCDGLQDRAWVSVLTWTNRIAVMLCRELGCKIYTI